MEELVRALEERIRSFVQQFGELKLSNQTLEKNKGLLIRQNHELQQRHQHVAEQIETMVARLKSIEGLS